MNFSLKHASLGAFHFGFVDRHLPDEIVQLDFSMLTSMIKFNIFATQL